MKTPILFAGRVDWEQQQTLLKPETRTQATGWPAPGVRFAGG